MKPIAYFLPVFSVGAASFLLCALGAGCAGDKPVSRIAPQAASSPSNHGKGDNSAAGAEVHRSVFTLDASSRDPFFPHARKVTEPVAGVTVAVQQTPLDINALLTAGLQGIGGTTNRRIAIINNVLLEPGRRTEIPVRINNQQRRLSVKCREIAKNSVALDVEGYGLVVVKAKSTL
jgi:hypothetical protein